MNTASLVWPEIYGVVMVELVGIILIAVFFLAAIAWRLREGIRARHAVRDDTCDPSVSPMS